MTATELLRRGREDEIWSRYCGFIDLGLTEFIEIQKGLSLEQLQLLGQCELARKLLNGKVPATVEEFQHGYVYGKGYVPSVVAADDGGAPTARHSLRPGVAGRGPD